MFARALRPPRNEYGRTNARFAPAASEQLVGRVHSVAARMASRMAQCRTSKMLCGAVSQKLAIARTVEASNPPTDPYSSQMTHTGNNRPLLHAWTTLKSTAGPTAIRRCAGRSASRGGGSRLRSTPSTTCDNQIHLSGDGVVPHNKEVRDLLRVRAAPRPGHQNTRQERLFE